ncbi:MAG: LPS export ABC transporter periplasmic protein LptC [Melioribacteraceae bacterium]|nr:LPS export ABC transporter periplasmic protein LptC [Melioribacteraceae bacterium]
MSLKNIIFLTVLAVSFSFCSKNKVKPVIVESLTSEEIPDQEIYNSKVRITELGELKAILYFDTLRKYTDTEVTLLKSVKIHFYNEEGVNTSTLTSVKGKINNKTNDMYAIENVVAASDSGVTLYTEELMWRNKDQKIVTEEFVTIVNGEDKTEGYGFESDQSLVNYKIFHPVFTSQNNNGIK